MNGTIDDSPSEFTKFREAVKKALLGTYVTTLEEVELVLVQERDMLNELFVDGSVEEAAAVFAVTNDLADK